MQPTVQASVQSPVRIHYMDNLRALAMMAGVFFHAALAYSPLLYYIFPNADRQQSEVVDVLIWFPHLFRMPLFFLVAGFFAAMLVARRGLGGMLANRLRRVALPFVIFWPLVTAGFVFAFLYAAQNVEHPSPILAMVKQLSQMENAPRRPPSTAHLWFLYYLVFFYTLVGVFLSLGLKSVADRVRNLHPAVHLALLPLLLTPALASVTAPHPAPESFIPQFWAMGFFGLYFGFGYLLFNHEAIIDRYRAAAPWLMVGSLALYVLFLYLLDHRESQEAGAAAHWLIALVEAYVGAWMTVVCLVVGKTLLNRGSGVLRYIADSSYWVYILHLPILFAIQYWLLDSELGLLAKYSISLSLTLAICLASYQLLVRHTLVGKLLNGARPKSVDFAQKPLKKA